tara:strand:+ start:331 stop:504 length:174 start_codon:yes stop_codon:yes gene_type:complete
MPLNTGDFDDISPLSPLADLKRWLNSGNTKAQKEYFNQDRRALKKLNHHSSNIIIYD